MAGDLVIQKKRLASTGLGPRKQILGMGNLVQPTFHPSKVCVCAAKRRKHELLIGEKSAEPNFAYPKFGSEVSDLSKSAFCF